MAPNLVDFTFGGQPCRGGVSQKMTERLSAVEARLRDIWVESGYSESFEKWCGFHEPHVGYRHGAGHHGTGSAVDINVSTNPYFVTRTGATFGGEAAASDQIDMRRRAVEACDRAVQFVLGSNHHADLSIRVNDTIEVTYDRFATVSNCLVEYFGYVFSDHLIVINRPPIPLVHELFDGDPAFDQISGLELGSVGADKGADGEARKRAFGHLEQVMSERRWRDVHPGWLQPEQQYWQILRDYELVRIPMLHGNPSQPVERTRNPARGIVDLRREVVIELVRTGRMRWGASDFGARQSGDVMHFDLGAGG